MATKKKEAPAIIDNVEALIEKIKAMKVIRRYLLLLHRNRSIRSFLKQQWQLTRLISRWQRWQWKKPEWALSKIRLLKITMRLNIFTMHIKIQRHAV